MNREELSHVLRAATTITDDPDILVIGSQAILGTHGEQSLPDAATMSIEADIAFRDDPGERRTEILRRPFFQQAWLTRTYFLNVPRCFPCPSR